jgi:starch synthase
VIYNGIDTDFYRPDPEPGVLERIGVDLSRPYVAFVGRITRQKGVPHLLRAAQAFDRDLQVVLLAGAADTPELKAETDGLIADLEAQRDGVFVVSEMLPREEVRQVLTRALAFLCPSVYEPLGIVNLEAMACETAVVASDVGGIPEVVADGLTGLLVPYHAVETAEFEAGLAAAINELCADPARAAAMGKAGRERAVHEFSWDAIAHRTVELYRSLL